MGTQSLNTLKLRAIKQNDLDLMEAWLQKTHVKQWFEHPEEWLKEIRGRKTTFSFIKHFIVERSGQPVGFCQYYPYKKGGEDWYKGADESTYSIDYLIGEKADCGRGLGKNIIRLITQKAFRAGASRIVVQPDEDNGASRGVLIACGFQYDDQDLIFYLDRPKRHSAGMWSPWRGCARYSEGCTHCYIFSGDLRRGKDASVIERTKQFDAPVRKDKHGRYYYDSGTVFYTCFASDFLLPACDSWREEAWDIIRTRDDCKFLFLTKRIERFMECVPSDWGAGYEHVIVCVTCEDQKQIDYRVPILKKLPIRHKVIVCTPMLTPVDLASYLDETIEQVVAGGESGPPETVRPCNYEWILSLRQQCIDAEVDFYYKQTGSVLIQNGVRKTIHFRAQHALAREANLNYHGNGINYMPSASPIEGTEK